MGGVRIFSETLGLGPFKLKNTGFILLRSRSSYFRFWYKGLHFYPGWWFQDFKFLSLGIWIRPLRPFLSLLSVSSFPYFYGIWFCYIFCTVCLRFLLTKIMLSTESLTSFHVVKQLQLSVTYPMSAKQINQTTGRLEQLYLNTKYIFYIFCLLTIHWVRIPVCDFNTIFIERNINKAFYWFGSGKMPNRHKILLKVQKQNCCTT